MIDYKDIEKRLEDALSKETRESLLEWLKNHEVKIADNESLSDVEAKVKKIFAVDDIEYDFDENKFGDRDKLEKYFEEKIKPFVLGKIIQYKMNIGDSFYFSERGQEAGVWQIKLLGRKYFVDIEEKIVDEKYLDIEVYLDDWYFD